MADLERVLAGRLREMRAGLGWSQREVAARMRAFGFDWNQTNVSKIEAGTRGVRVNEAAAFALLFDVPLGELLDAAGPGPQAAAGETERAIRERIAAEILGRHPADLGPDAEEFGQLAADDEDVAASAGVSDVLLSRTVPIRPAVTTGSDDGWFCGYP